MIPTDTRWHVPPEATKLAVLLNPAAGSAQEASVGALLRSHLPGAQLLTAHEGSDIPPLIRQAVAAGCSLIVAGGGDGTIRTVAQELVGTPAILGVLPLGTRNHFARHLRIPLELDRAVQLLAKGEPRVIDVGEVNGRTFLLYAALGLYPLFVREREGLERLGRRHTGFAFGRALWAALRRYPYLDVRLDAAGNRFASRTPFVFITNNIATVEHLPFGIVTCPHVGQLGLYTAHRLSRLGLLRLTLRLLTGRLMGDADLQELSTREVRVETHHRHVWVAMDGEVTRMDAPLQASVRIGALRVWVPKDEACPL